MSPVVRHRGSSLSRRRPPVTDPRIAVSVARRSLPESAEIESDQQIAEREREEEEEKGAGGGGEPPENSRSYRSQTLHSSV
ncbi:hypothetical protein GN956_G3427 [Arapaima gigas]